MTPLSKTIESFRQCRTPQDVGSVLGRAIEDYGLTTYAVGGIPPPSDPNPTPFTIHNWPIEWGETYMRQGFGAIDPIPRAAMIASLPFTLAELRSGSLGIAIGPECDLYFAMAEKIGRRTALIVPIHGPVGYHGLAVFAGPGPQIPFAARLDLHLLGVYAHNSMLNLFNQKTSTTLPHLTPREVEILRHARNGLSDQDIARTVGISVRTVRFHFQNARARLTAKTRSEALVLAVNNHLLGA